MRFGCAYWGRDPDTAVDHLDELQAAGFSWLVIPVSTERMRFDRPATARIVALARHAGLETRLAPWGVGGLFGGEGVAARGGTPGDAAWEWVDAALHILEGNAIYWDEPQEARALNWLRTAWPELRGITQYLYANPERCGWPDTVPPEVAGIGVDAYQGLDAGVAAWNAAVFRYGTHVKTHVWVRSFGLGVVDANHPAEMIRALAAKGVRDIGVWGYPAAGCSVLDNARPRETWDAIVQAVQEVRR